MAVLGGLTTSTAYATPPSEVTLSYDKAKQVLHVVAKHPSDRLTRHYLRHLVIYRNDVAVDTLSFARQMYAWGMEEDVALPAEGGDLIRIEMFCSKGGIGKGQTQVPADDE